MKNRSIGIIISLIILTLVMGCSWWNPLASKPENNRSNTATKNTKATPAATEKPLEDKAIDTVLGEEKIGIPECDELVDSIAKESESEDDGYGAKAIRGYFMNKIRESVKKSIEEDKNDPAKLAKECREFKEQLDKYKAEEEKKKP
jgi:hypothetical protein